MSKISEALAELREAGFVVADDNVNVEFTSDAARALYATYADRFERYVIGSVPASNEYLASVDFDICFYEIDHFVTSGYLPGYGLEYDQLHEFVHVSDVDVFVDLVADYVENYIRTVGRENFQSALIDLIDAVTTNRDSVLEEINDLIVDLNQHA